MVYAESYCKRYQPFFCKYYERTGVCPAFYNCSFEVGERSEVGAIEVLKNIRKLLSEKFTLRSNLQNLSTAYPPDKTLSKCSRRGAYILIPQTRHQWRELNGSQYSRI